MILSVTISVYNVEQFIEASIKSILAQSFTKFELICIDDCSSDRTTDIIKTLAINDDRIKLFFTEQNKGLSYSRNRALSLAKGKYILFLDGDDIYHPKMFETAVHTAETNTADVILWDYLVFYEKSDLKAKNGFKSQLPYGFCSDQIFLLRCPAFTWTKLFRLDYLKELGICFPFGLTRQDIYVHWQIFTSSPRVFILPSYFSFYRQQPSATTARKSKNLLDLALVYDLVYEYLEKNKLYETFKDEYIRQRLNTLFGMHDNIAPKLKQDALNHIIARLKQDEWDYINSKKNLRYNARIFYKTIEGKWSAKIKRGLWLFFRMLFRNLKKVING